MHMKMNFIIISSCFGHEFGALLAAKALGMSVKVVSKKDNKEEYEKDVNNIYDQLSPFYDNIEVVPFEERERFIEAGWDFVQDLKDGKLDPSIWDKMAATKLEPSFEGLPEYPMLADGDTMYWTPQKWQTDGTCGASAAQQSLNPVVFLPILKKAGRVLFGQHYNKVTDMPSVLELQEWMKEELKKDMYVLGQKENPEVLGIRGVKHVLYLKMFKKMKCAVGTPGTATWILLACFPEVAQLIPFNEKVVEDWELIAAAYQRAGHKIFAEKYCDNSDMSELSQRLDVAYDKLF